MEISIIIPTYNEAENIGRIIDRVNQIFQKNEIKGEIIIIDDNSPDGTRQVVKNQMAKYKNVRLYEREKKSGLGSAYKFGFQYAISPVIMEMDADLSHPPEYIPDFLEALKSSDFVIGSRYMPGGGIRNWPVFRKLVSFIANYLARIFLNLKFKDLTTGYRAYRRESLDKIDMKKIKSNRFAFQIEITKKLTQKGCKGVEIPFIFDIRKKGKSKFSIQDIMEFLLILIRH